ncbi:hypothetical protein ACHAXN_012011 [Cyclotella atomus]
MGGPTNTTPRYRPPPPGTAPPPPPPPSDANMPQQQQYGQQQQQQNYGQYPAPNASQSYAQQSHAAMGGQGQAPNSFHQSQMQHQFHHMPGQQQQQYQQPQQSNYNIANQHYVQQPPPAATPSYYTQQVPQQQHQPPAQQQQQPAVQRPPAQGSYAARSIAANSPHGSIHNTTSPHPSTHGQTNPSTTTNTDSANIAHLKGLDPAFVAEQTRLLTNATRKVAEASSGMNRAMEENDAVGVLEMACVMLEELGDPNHGVKGQGGTGARNGPGQGVIHSNNPYVQPPYHNVPGGPVAPYNTTFHHQSSHGTITPLSPKNYYELHMRAMDELPVLEEYLLNLCHVPMPIQGGAGPTNMPYNHHSTLAQFTTGQLHEAVQYCPRVVPRLYLQICMGSVSIRAGERKAVDVMDELSDAAKCVQCPVRGLFLRYYLLMALKDKLPDGGGVEEIVDESRKNAEMGIIANELMVSGPTAPPPDMPPPPPPLEESSLAKHTELFPEQSEGDLFGDSKTSPPPPVKESALISAGLIGEKEGDLFGDLNSNSLFSEPVGASPLDNNAAAPVEPPPPPPQPDVSAPIPTPTPDTQSAPQPHGPRVGTVKDSYEFILNNLFEMNRLWIRIQHMPGDKTKETKRRRERERNDLRILVGSNLNRLSQLEGITAHTYGSFILPKILEEVATCRDALAQAYLLDCIIQVFPDEFHIETLEVFLGVLPRLKDKVNVRTILNNMMERLLHYYQEKTLVNGDADTNDVKQTMAIYSFDMFEECVRRVFEAKGTNIPPKDVIRLQGALLSYTLKIAPGNIDHISRCIGLCALELNALQEQKKASMMGQGIVVGGVTRSSMELDMEEVAITELEKLLSVPLDQVALRVLNMPEFSSLLAFLPWQNRRKVALSMLKAVISGGEEAKVRDIGEEEQLFAIIAPLLRDEGVPPPGMYDNNMMEQGGSLISRTANLMGTLGISSSPMPNDPFAGGAKNPGMAQFREEQSLVAKLVHVLEHEDTDLTYQMLNVARKYLQPGGPERVSVTMPALVFASLKLLRRVQQLEFPVRVEVSRDESGQNGENAAIESTAETFAEVEALVECNEEKSDSDKNPDKSDDIADGETEATRQEIAVSGTNEETEAEQGDVVVEEKDEANSNAQADTALDTTEKEEIASETTPESKPAPLFEAFTKTVNCRKILVFLQKSVAMLATSSPELAFKFYLEIAVATDLLAFSVRSNNKDSAEFSGIAYDFMTQAFLVYEDDFSDSKAQVRSITSIVGSLLSCRTFERTDYEALITKTAQYAAKLLKKPDQCRMVCLVSRLFYVVNEDANAYRNPQRVLECLQRSLKIADACSMSSSANLILFVEILDYYVYYYEIENPAITDKFVTGLIALINEHFSTIGSAGSAAVEEARSYYNSVLKGINKRKKEKDTSDRFGLIVC